MEVRRGVAGPSLRRGGNFGTGRRYRRQRRLRRGERDARARSQAERAVGPVGCVLRFVVRFVTGSAVMSGMSLGPRGRGLVRASIVAASRCFARRIVLHRGRSRGNGQHPAQYVGSVGEQRRGQRRRHRAEQHRGKRDPGVQCSAGTHLKTVCGRDEQDEQDKSAVIPLVHPVKEALQKWHSVIPASAGIHCDQGKNGSPTSRG